ncbi:MAG: response regulator transcription factor, partial [Verrucomicrobiales bacterium]|nr:response regulator transcription factor [Verrucomicrobiales bacterium]
MSTPAPTATDVKRIAIVDDHTMMREGVSTFVDSLDGFITAWQAVDCADTIRHLEKDVPDVIMVDITLPDRNGLELIKDIRMLAPRLPILVLSMHDEKLYAPRALKAGAQGYLMKD